VPASVALLLLLTLPRPESLAARCVLPAIGAVLLPLTGLGSGACQEAFRSRAEGRTPGLLECLRAAWQRGLEHAAARAVLIAAGFVGSLCLIMPGLALWISFTTVHPILSEGGSRLLPALTAAGHEVQRHPAKAAAVTLSRVVLLLLAVINLHMLVQLGLWAGSLAGLDTALLGILISLGNPVYLVSLVLLSWLLLAPYAEAVNYLLHVDARARFEGLDLWYRVRRLFPVADKTGSGRRVGILLLALGTTLLGTTPAHADEARLTAVQRAREQVEQITQEVKEADPYPGSDVWFPRLRSVGRDLERTAGPRGARHRWFDKAMDGFANRGQEGALQVLAVLDRKLALLEESLIVQPGEPASGGDRPLSKREIKDLLPREASDADRADRNTRRSERVEQDPELKRPVRKDDPKAEKRGRSARGGPGISAPQLGGGFGLFAWAVVGGLFLAIMAVAVVLYWQGRGRRSSAAPRETGRLAPSVEAMLSLPQQSVAALWRQAEDLARQGNYLEAVRILYLAVLVLLHRANLIRYERTRTNGEYADQLREQAALQGPFRRLTLLFEGKWYGERACQPDDYAACRGLAEEVRDKVTG